jgi:hypothetical protein
MEDIVPISPVGHTWAGRNFTLRHLILSISIALVLHLLWQQRSLSPVTNAHKH